MPQFDVSSFSSQLFWLVIAFTFLYILVSKFIAPKAESILTARNRCLEKNISYADKYNTKVKSINISRLENLAKINSQVEDMHQKAMDMLEMHFNKQKEKLEESIAKKRHLARDEINNYVDTFHTDASKYSINLAAFIIKKVTKKPADLTLLKKIHGKTK